MDVSVIVSTYNEPDWLEKAVWGWDAQSERGFELLVADDGSGPETAERIERLRAETGLTIRHVWQEDEGFRKSAILNRAIEAAEGDYLVFSDGDCIPRADFLATHTRLGPFLDQSSQPSGLSCAYALLLPFCGFPNSSTASSIGVPCDNSNVASMFRRCLRRSARIDGSEVVPSAP